MGSLGTRGAVTVAMADEMPDTVRLTCHAAMHQLGAPPLGDIPAVHVEFVGTGHRLPPEPDGRLWLRCPSRDCRSWNCFEWMNDGES
jgi:hypothetical protein